MINSMKKLYAVIVLTFISLIVSEIQAQSNLYLHFDGVDDHVRYEDIGSLLNGSNTISMTGWFNPDNLNYGSGLMGIRGEGSGNSGMYVLMLSDGKLECRVITLTGTHQVVAPANSITVNQWNHIAWVWNQSTLTLYINGILIGSSTASGLFQATNRPYAIGKCIFPGYNFIYTGKVDEVTLWNKALTQAEVTDMMANELIGTETDLLLYYKFDQGTPFDDNTFITELHSETGTTYDSSLLNFALTGTTSNFGGTLDAGFQSINFPTIGTHTTDDVPFDLNAFSSSGLPISYSIESGPATISGNTVTLTGVVGDVVVKASQAGNTQYNAATDVLSTFSVVDPQDVLPQVELTNPASGTIYMPTLSAVQLAATASIGSTDMFSVESVSFQIGSETIPAFHHGNGFYTAWWTPSSFGTHTIDLVGTNNYGYSNTVSSSVNVTSTTVSQNANAGNQVWVYSQVYSEEVEAILPTSTGAFNEIMGSLTISCPSGGCDPWDRVSHVEVQGHDGRWYEIIRYLTPYGVACNHSIDLTDFASLLQGKVKFRYSLGTSGNGFLYTLNLQYTEGAPTYKYSTVEPMWNDTYAFGDMANLQPYEVLNVTMNSSVAAAKIKLVATGHGWGANNTDNAAEFHHDYHHIWVNGASTFTHNNWNICNPNPDNCSPQNGTWYYARAGWCPGSIAQFFDFDLTPYLSNTMELKYILDENYVDLCHPNNPNCVTGVTCDNCNDGFNPHLITDSYLIRYSNDVNYVLHQEMEEITNSTMMYPNPTNGKFTIENELAGSENEISIYTVTGSLVYQTTVSDSQKLFAIDLSDKPTGVYIVHFKNENTTVTQKIVIE